MKPLYRQIYVINSWFHDEDHKWHRCFPAVDIGNQQLIEMEPIYVEQTHFALKLNMLPVNVSP